MDLFQLVSQEAANQPYLSSSKHGARAELSQKENLWDVAEKAIQECPGIVGRSKVIMAM